MSCGDVTWSVQRQIITSTNDDLWLIGPSKQNFHEFLIKHNSFLSRKWIRNHWLQTLSHFVLISVCWFKSWNQYGFDGLFCALPVMKLWLHSFWVKCYRVQTLFVLDGMIKKDKIDGLAQECDNSITFVLSHQNIILFRPIMPQTISVFDINLLSVLLWISSLPVMQFNIIYWHLTHATSQLILAVSSQILHHPKPLLVFSTFSHHAQFEER